MAMGDLGVALLQPDSNQAPRWLEIDSAVQTKIGGAVSLKILGSTLFVAQDSGGVLIYDLSDLNAIELLSAGTSGVIKDLGYFKDRLIATRDETGVASIQLPGALVTSVSVEHQGTLAKGSELLIGFNEFIDTSSLVAGTSVVLTDLTSNQVVDMTLVPLNEQNSASDRYKLQFNSLADHVYELRVLEAKTVRGPGLFVPFKRQFTQSSISQPKITWIEDGLVRRGVDQEVIIHGERFDSGSVVTVGAYTVPATVEENRISFNSSSLDLLPLKAGQYPVRVEQEGLSDWFMGGLVIADSLEDSQIVVDRKSGPLSGGYRITVTADKALFLPGMKSLVA